METNLQEVRREIEQTRARLGEKLVRLQEEVERTKRTTLNPAYHMRMRPLQTFGISVLAGWLLGRMAKPHRSKNNSYPVAQPARRHDDYPQTNGRGVVARAALAGVRATASSFIFRDLMKSLVGDFVRRRWSGQSASRERRGR